MEKVINKKNKGFTIAELIVVMAIIAILILISVPAFTKYIDDANNTSDIATANTLYKSALSAVVEDYTSTTHTPVITDADISITDDGIGKNIINGVDGLKGADGSAKIRVIGYYSTPPTERLDSTTEGTWEVYIPTTSATIVAGVADITQNIYIISPDGTVYENGKLSTTTEK